MNILITGKGSYIGFHIKTYFEKFGHMVTTVDTVSDEWKSVDYSLYDSVVHVAAIVHDDAKTAYSELFKKVNTELPYEIALKAKENGVKQFVFISSMAVYGAEKSLDKESSVLNKDSKLEPTSLYGISKLEAEKLLAQLQDDNFKVSFVRPPNVYGPGCRGNYIYLFKKLADLLFICPYVYTDIRQSMIYIDNLSELIRLIVENDSSGYFSPQDDVAPNTVEIITTIRDISGKKTRYSKVLGNIIKIFRKMSLVNKIYGGVCYSDDYSECFDNKYQIVSFKEGMETTYKNL